MCLERGRALLVVDEMRMTPRHADLTRNMFAPRKKSPRNGPSRKWVPRVENRLQAEFMCVSLAVTDIEAFETHGLDEAADGGQYRDTGRYMLKSTRAALFRRRAMFSRDV